MSFDDFNKVAGAAIGSLLVFLLLGFFSNKLFYSGGHEEDEPLAFALAVEEETEVAEAEAEEETVDLAALVADADPANGETVFRQCQACHQVEDGVNGVGPHLNNVMGREIANVGAFGYSDALSAKEGEWDVATMSAWLENPAEWAPGTTMGYAGLKDPQDRVDVMAWINEQSSDPVDLAALAPEPRSSEPEEAAEAEPADAAETEMAAADATGEAADEADAAAGGGEYAALLASADISAGEQAFRQCQACHKVQDGVNGVGPHLYGVIGREIAGVADYSYSDALSSKEGDWGVANMMEWLGNPAEFAQGNKMGYAVEDAQTRMNLIAWLNTQADAEADLGAMLGGGAAGEAAEDEATGGSGAEDDRAAAGEAGETTETAAADPDASGVSDGSDAPAADDAAADAAAEEAGGDAAAEETATDAGGTETASLGAGGEYADLLANATADAGEQAFRQCQACHKVQDGVNGVGPHLHGVIGREIAAVDGYRYSDALGGKDGIWNVANMMEWLGNPNEFAQGNKMGYAVQDAQTRMNLIVYLNEADGTPEPLQ